MVVTRLASSCAGSLSSLLSTDETTGDTKMQTVTTKYLPATNTRGARIKVSSWLGNKTFSYDYSASCAHEAAFNEWLNDLNERFASGFHSNNLKVNDGNWFKLVAKGSLPDGKGYGFIVK